MDIHEYQAKEILAGFGVPVPRGGLAWSPEQAAFRARELGDAPYVVKAQIHSGGRGEAGGVKLCATDEEVRAYAATLFGQTLCTKQTGARGKSVHRVWVEEASDIARELYLGFVLDRKSERIMIVASQEGGMEIEQLAEEQPDALLRMTIDPAVGLVDYQARELAFDLGLKGPQIAQMVTVLQACHRAYSELDAMMVEINPLVVTGAGDLVALDAKMSFDTNALYRRPEIAALRDAGIGIYKLQLSAALRVAEVGAESRRQLSGFAEPVYLHQVTGHAPGGGNGRGELLRVDDLPALGEALERDPASILYGRTPPPPLSQD